jgi:hypothetical protein
VVVHVTYPGVYVEELPAGVKAIEGVPTSTAAFVGSGVVGPVAQAVRVRSLADFERAFGPAPETDPLRLGVQLFFANGGTDAVVVRVDRGAGPEPSVVAGLQALDGIERFDLLGLPGLYADTTPKAIPQIAAALEAASRYCARRGAILIIDPLPGWQSVDDVVSGPASIDAIATGVQRENAIAFYPNLLVATPNRPEPCAPAGVIAGVFARTDTTRGVWKAPAGTEAAIRGVVGLASPISTTEASTLRGGGVNSIREIPGAGIIPWGARLLSGITRGDPEWKYVNIRRQLIYLERSIDEGLAWVVFEPNDEPLWARIRQSVGAFLFGLWREGAFAGRHAGEAYFVRCGPDTMTQDEIDAGVVNVLVGFAPLRPAEFIIIRIQQLPPDD